MTGIDLYNHYNRRVRLCERIHGKLDSRLYSHSPIRKETSRQIARFTSYKHYYLRERYISENSILIAGKIVKW